MSITDYLLYFLSLHRYTTDKFQVSITFLSFILLLVTRYTTDKFQVSITMMYSSLILNTRYTTDNFRLSITTTLCKDAKTLLADSFFAIEIAVKTNSFGLYHVPLLLIIRYTDASLSVTYLICFILSF